MKCIEPTMFFLTVLGIGNIKVGHFALNLRAKDLINEAIYMLVNIRQSNMDLVGIDR